MEEMVLVVMGLLMLSTLMLRTVPVVRMVFEMLVTRMVWLSEAEHPITVDRPFVIDSTTVEVQAPTAIDI